MGARVKSVSGIEKQNKIIFDITKTKKCFLWVLGLIGDGGKMGFRESSAKIDRFGYYKNRTIVSGGWAGVWVGGLLLVG